MVAPLMALLRNCMAIFFFNALLNYGGRLKGGLYLLSNVLY
jgi:hypothetical protein